MVDIDEGMTLNYRENGQVEVHTIWQTKKPATLRGRSQMDVDIHQSLDDSRGGLLASKALIDQAKNRHQAQFTNNQQNT